MAYNPFNIFRRNQKTIFAVVTVFIMFTFVLSSGLGGGADFFDWFPNWIRTKRGGEELCRIDGDKITTRELDDVRQKRVMANRFMSLAAGETIRTLDGYINQSQTRVGPEGQRVLNQAQGIIAALREQQLTLRDAQTLSLMADGLSALVDMPTARAEDKDAIRAVQALYRLYAQLALAGGDHYFTNAANRTQRDLIEFLLWERKADKLGIQFNEDDVKALIQREFYAHFKSDVNVRAQLKDMPGFTLEACLKAIGTEFKVRAAQKAILGYGGVGAPAYSTPYEMFDYYRDQASTAVYEVISVPSLAFVERVTAEPSEAELSELFKKHKDDEPNPRRETPGFKQPRKVAVGWISATGEEPYYKKLADEHLRVGEAMAKASGMLTVPLPGATGAWAIGAGAPLSAKEPLVYSGYDNQTVFQHNMQLRNQYSSSSMFARDLLTSSIVRPGTMAALAGGLAGQGLGFGGNPVTAASLAMGASMGYEIRDRVKVGVPLVLGFAPSPALIPTIAGAGAASKLAEPKPLPVEAVRPELIKKVAEQKAKELMRRDLVQFAMEVWILGGNAKPQTREDVIEMAAIVVNARVAGFTTVDKYIQDFVAARGIQMGGSNPAPGSPPGSPPMPRDEWTLEDDPGLKPLVLAQREGLDRARSAHGPRNEYIPFGQSFFWTERNTRQGPMREATSGLYVPQFYPEQRVMPDPYGIGPAKPQYLVWRTVDQPAAQTNLVTAREAVRAAWKRMEARKLADARANAIANTIRADSATSPELIRFLLTQQLEDLRKDVKDEKAQGRVRKFALTDVAPLAPGQPRVDPRNPFAPPQARRGSVEPYSLPESENIPFPTREMVDALLSNRDKPPKTTFVMTDAGRDTYYVATLLRREMKDVEDFKDHVYSTMGAARFEVGQGHMRNTALKSRQSIFELLKREFKYQETEEQKKKLDENAKSGGRD